MKPKTKRKNVKVNTTDARPRKISNLYVLIIAIVTIVLLVASIIMFGALVTLIIMLLFGIMIALTINLDRYPKHSSKRKLIKTLCIIILAIAIIGICSFILFFIYIAVSAPKFDTQQLVTRETTRVYDNKNKLVATFGSDKRENVTYDEIPEVLIDAIIATEDSRFFQHNGLDAPRFAKAVVGQLLGRDAGGGSTLTMQVVKKSFTSDNATGIKGIIRKFTDIYLSVFKMEKAYSKQEIIEFYANIPFLGSNSFGIEQASQTYFSKHATELNLSEASLIAGLFQAPSSYDPNMYPENAAERRSTVLSLMVRHGYITQEQADIANSIEVKDLLSSNSSSYATSEYQGYLDTVYKEVSEKYGFDPYVVSMDIYTNMDTKKQEALNDIFNGKTYRWPNKTIQAGVVAIDSSSGKIIALGAGRNRKGELTFSYATDIKRQIGSTAKPIFDYAPGIEYENWSTAKIFSDRPTTYTGGAPVYNYDRSYKGNITLRYALSDSRNIPALKAFKSVDNEKIKKFVTTLGMTPEIDSTGYMHEAHALGAFDGTSPLQLAAAFQAFSNGGYYYEPYTVNKIVLRNSDEVIDENETAPEKVKAMSDSTAYMIADVLKQTAKNIGVYGVVSDQISLKTGTTNYDDETRALYGYPSGTGPDGLVAGFTPTISLSLWTGYTENKKGQFLYEGTMYAHKNALYKACAKAIFDNNGAKFKKPSSVVAVKLERGTEMLASKNTPSNMIITELFKRGTEPTEKSSRYNTLDAPTGFTATYSNGKVKLSWNSVNKPDDTSEKSYGSFGYRLYKDGKQIGFTTNNYYTYTPSYPYGTYSIRTSFKNVTTNMSASVRATIESKVRFEFNDNSEETLSIGDSYVPNSNPISVYENDEDVTSSAKITSTIVDNSTNTTVSEIDTSVVGSYTINYKVSYRGESESFSKTITVS